MIPGGTDVAFIQACSFSCCTALCLSVVPPVTSIKELSLVIPGGTDVISQCTEQPFTVPEVISNIIDAITPMYRRTSTIGAENSILLAYSCPICSHLLCNKSILLRNKSIFSLHKIRLSDLLCNNLSINSFYRATNVLHRSVRVPYTIYVCAIHGNISNTMFVILITGTTLK